jgi:hypothetical protein
MNFCGHAHLSSAMRAAVAQRIEQPFDSGAGRRFESYQRLVTQEYDHVRYGVSVVASA